MGKNVEFIFHFKKYASKSERELVTGYCTTEMTRMKLPLLFRASYYLELDCESRFTFLSVTVMKQ